MVDAPVGPMHPQQVSESTRTMNGLVSSSDCYFLDSYLCQSKLISPVSAIDAVYPATGSGKRFGNDARIQLVKKKYKFI